MLYFGPMEVTCISKNKTPAWLYLALIIQYLPKGAENAAAI